MKRNFKQSLVAVSFAFLFIFVQMGAGIILDHPVLTSPAFANKDKHDDGHGDDGKDKDGDKHKDKDADGGKDKDKDDDKGKDKDK
jgi:hypothetical protein